MPSIRIQFDSHAEMAAAFGPVAGLLREAIVIGARDRANLATYFDQVRRELIDSFKNDWFSEGVSYQAEAQVASKALAMIEAIIEAAKADVVKEGRSISNTTDNEIAFRGAGPFNLPTAQRASATAHAGNGVTLTIYSLVRIEGESETTIEAINAQMISSVARELGAALLQAATESNKDAK